MEQKKRWRPSLTAYRELERKVEGLTTENSALERSNRLMEQELKLLRSKIGLLEEIADNRAAEVERMRSRGFWSRVFNR